MLRALQPLELDNEAELETELANMLKHASGKTAKFPPNNPIPKNLRKTKTIPGVRFGELIIVSKVNPPRDLKHLEFNCLCDCGALTIERGENLRKGRTTMCRRCFNFKYKGMAK